jgi:homoserine O-acetyltransferase/O-succinyltransferase
MNDYEIFETQGFALQKGSALPAAKLVYKTLGTLSAARDNAVLIPSWYSGTHREAEYCMVGPGRAIDPAKHFVVLTNLLSGGLSSSPSNTPPPFEAARFPRVTLHDNVRLQHMLLTQHLGIERVKLVAGWSMGGCQAFQWGKQYPDFMQAIAPLCCSARTANFNKVFLLSLRRALTLDPAYAEGYYTRAPIAGLKAFAAIYAGWGFSEPFYRTGAFREFGATTCEEFVANFWEGAMLHHDANDLLTLLQTWYDGDIADGGDYDAALRSIKARTVIMPGQYDSYFPPADSEYEASKIPGAVCRVIPSIWGHMTLWNPEDRGFIDAGLRLALGE